MDIRKFFKVRKLNISSPSSNNVKKLYEHLTNLTVNHEAQVMSLSNLKEAHVYCVIHNLSTQRYGPLLEKFIRVKFNYKKLKVIDCAGDGSKNGRNVEIKVSLGGRSHNKFNFVQLRPSHSCTAYILTAYHLSIENVRLEGELFIFIIPAEDIKRLILSFGGYAHGTTKEHGSISEQTLTKEYAIRPKINDACWRALLPFRVSENSL